MFIEIANSISWLTISKFLRIQLINYMTNEISVNGKPQYTYLVQSKSFWMLIILGAIMIRIAALILEIKKEEERTIDMLQGKIASLEEELRKMNSRVREALDRKAEAQISSVDEDFWGSVLIFQKWKEAVK
jgi:hypothetical protein